jgi:glycerol-3-phosphate dehydrogenase
MNEADGGISLTEGLPYTVGEMRYCARAELACTLGDLFIRRTHLAFETRDHGLGAAALLAPFLGWNTEGQRRALATYGGEVERIFSIDPA